MLSLGSVRLIISLITNFLAYFLVATIAGSFKAWVVCALGDETPERMGFLTLNPLAHADPIGFFFLIIFGFGWGKHIFINPYNITGRFRTLKLLVAYLSDVFAYFVIATVSLVVLIVSFGPTVFGNLVKAQFVQAYPQSSSYAIALALIFVAAIYLSTLLAALSFIISGFSYLSIVFSDRLNNAGKYKDVLFLLIPMLLIFFFIAPLRVFVFWGIYRVGFIVAKFLGVA